MIFVSQPHEGHRSGSTSQTHSMSSRQSPKLGSPTALFDGQKFNGSTGNGVFPVEDGKSFLAVRSTADLGDETHKLVLAQSS